MIKKETIFVSHSSTSDDDNYFASWLAVKLKSLGYKVWIDLQDLKGGQSFWPNIENLIRVDSIRFLSCVSKSYIEKARTPKTGVQKELSCASNIDIDEFIIPLRIDESDWRDLPIHINELNGIDFLNNWAVGFNELLDLFTDDKIPQNQKTDDVLNFWYEAQKISSEIEDVKERYYTNWFKIQIPEKIFVHKINKAKIDNLSQLPFPFYQDKDLLISFFDDRVIKNSISINKTYQFNFQEFIDSMILRHLKIIGRNGVKIIN